MDKIGELRLDVGELESLLSQAKRSKVIDALTIEIRKRQTEIINLEQKLKETQPSAAESSNKTTATITKTYQVKLNNYAWDQSNKFVKFYVTVKNVHLLDDPKQVACKFTSKSLELNVNNLDGKDYVFVINNLLKKINPETSTWKIKTDMVLINVTKIDQTNWSHVTELEKKASESKKIVPDAPNMEDPTAGLMNIMKNMYEQGDDEMKRTIAKAWTESRDKGPNV